MRAAVACVAGTLLLGGCVEPYQPPPYTYVPMPSAPPGAIPLNGAAYAAPQPYATPGPEGLIPAAPPDGLIPANPEAGGPEPLNPPPGEPPNPPADPLSAPETPGPDAALPAPADQAGEAQQPAAPAPAAAAAPVPRAEPSAPASDIPLMGFRPLRGKSSASP